MTMDSQGKVQSRHLARDAYLYVRQSSLRQVLENTESTERQYALRQRALALGWPADQVVVVDSDLGRSAASATDRAGFQRLVTDVGLGRAGIVMGLEVSRLARNNADWHRLLEICALADTLILDEDGIYDPAHFNDRLLLGLKGTMSEAELHLLRARLIGGMMNKARRGELRCRLPIGFVYDARGRVALDPDRQVRQAVRLLFETFRRVGSATATVREFRRERLRFPQRVRSGPRSGEVVWGELGHHRALWILHHPRYAGAFCYGRSRQRKRGDGVRYRRLPREEWIALIPDAHAGYIAWDEFERNERRLRDNSAARGADRRAGPPREGPALLQGLAVCGVCGNRMTVRYRRSGAATYPSYLCQRAAIEDAGSPCQSISGMDIDRAVGDLAVETLTPAAVELTLAVQDELKDRFEAVDALRRQAVERAQYEADLARRRYMQVDPGNRLVADSLEAEWNEKLRDVHQARERCERERGQPRAFDEQRRAKIAALTGDFPKLWHDAATPDRERKRMLRLLIDDVTLRQDRQIVVHVRFRGGATRTLQLPRPLPGWARRQTSAAVVAAIDELLDEHTDAATADILNERGMRSGMDRRFNRLIVRKIRMSHGLKSRYDRLRESGHLTAGELAAEIGVSLATVNRWRLKGSLEASAGDDKPRHLYAPGQEPPMKYRPRSKRYAKVVRQRPEGVQCDA